MIAREESASSHDVFATRAADGAYDAVVGEIVAQPNHAFVVRAVHVHAWDGVPADEVDAASEAFEKTDKFAGVALHIVETFEDNIFERDAALVFPIVFFDFVDDASDAISLFGWHDFGAFVREWVVERDGEVAFGFIEELLHARDEPDARHCDATRTPCKAPVGS